MKRIFSLVAAALLIGTAIRTPAQISAAPPLVNFQGRFANPSGNPVPNGTYSIRFSLWDAATGGTEKWNQTIAAVQVRNGTFAVLLNTNTANLFNGNLWFEIKVGADPVLTPRQQIVSVPFALKANSVADGSITNNSVANGTLTADKFAANIFNPLAWLLGGNSGTNPNTQFLGTTDNQPLVFRTNNAERMRLREDGRVAIGRNTAIGAGRLTLSEDTNSYTGMYIDSGATGLPFYGYTLNGSNAVWTYLDGNDGNKWKLNYFGDKLAVTSAGNVGIGTNDPTMTLDVNGNIRSRGGDIVLNGRGGGFGNSGGAGRALVDTGDGAQVGYGGLVINFSNDYGRVWIDSDLYTVGALYVLSGGVVFPDGSVQTTAASGGGSGWSLTGNAGTNPATQFVGTTDNQPLILRSNNNRLLGLQFVENTISGETYTSGNVIGGYWLNAVTAGVSGATIAGGGHRYTISAGSTDSINRVTDMGGTVGGGSNNRAGDNDVNLLNGRWATVGGGQNNVAGSRFATVAGGLQNAASGVNSTVAGGWLNTASNLDSTVLGGQGNIASGQGAAIVGGTQNRASGSYTFAAGTYAEAAHAGAFVWGDFSSSSNVSSTAVNQFTVRAAGGVRFFSNSALTAGVSLSPGGGSWSSVSDRNAKTNLKSVDSDDILARLMGIPVTTWNYKSQETAIRHIGPMAQDFFAAFGVGEDERRITTIDADGVALAAIQALNRKVKALEANNATLKTKNAELEARHDTLEARLNALEKLLNSQAQK